MSYPLHIIHPIGGTNVGSETFRQTLRKLKGRVLGIKLHPAFIIYMSQSYNLDVMHMVKNEGFLLMVDDKSHDIRAEAASFVEMYETAGTDILTIHASGGSKMLRDAMAATQKMKLFGVTLLTSMDEVECHEVYGNSSKDTVLRLMGLVETANLHGSVCAPRDISWIRDEGIDVGARVRMCPGIRDPNVPISGDDQNLNRSLTPFEAGKANIGLMVIGRPISQSENPGDTAARFEEDFMRGKTA